MKPRILLAESIDGAPMSYTSMMLPIPLAQALESVRCSYYWISRVERQKGEDPHFKARMKTVGFRIGKIRAKVHAASKRAAYVITWRISKLTRIFSIIPPL